MTHHNIVETIPVRKLTPDAVLPTRSHPNDAGLDLYAVEDVILPPGAGRTIKTGIAMALPTGFVGMIADRSSLAKKGIKIAGGIVDAGYRGEVMVVVWNIGGAEIRLQRGERIAQMMIIPIATPPVREVHVLDETSRGSSGFGSTGK